jgi:hypothetical protein
MASLNRSARKSHNVKVKGIPRKEIDTEQLAMVFWLQAKRMVKERKEKGLPPPERTPEQRAEFEKAFPEYAKLRKQVERMQKRLREPGVDPDTE